MAGAFRCVGRETRASGAALAGTSWVIAGADAASPGNSLARVKAQNLAVPAVPVSDLASVGGCGDSWAGAARGRSPGTHLEVRVRIDAGLSLNSCLQNLT